MDITDSQEMIRRIYYERDKARGVERTVLRTFQELGELSDSILRKKKKDEIVDEVADVFAWLISIANLLDIDMSEALLKKYNDACSKCRNSPCQCVDEP